MAGNKTLVNKKEMEQRMRMSLKLITPSNFALIEMELKKI
jgi:hypothetical protein